MRNVTNFVFQTVLHRKFYTDHWIKYYESLRKNKINKNTLLIPIAFFHPYDSKSHCNSEINQLGRYHIIYTTKYSISNPINLRWISITTERLVQPDTNCSWNFCCNFHRVCNNGIITQSDPAIRKAVNQIILLVVTFKSIMFNLSIPTHLAPTKSVAIKGMLFDPKTFNSYAFLITSASWKVPTCGRTA